MFARLFTTAFSFLLLATPALAQELTVGGKNYTEQFLMAEMTTQLLEGHGYDINKVDGMGSSLLRQGQESGEVDVYWEYTGTSLITYNKVKEKLSSRETYNRVKELDKAKGIIWLNPSRANNTYALAMRKSDSADKGISSLSDMAVAYNDGKKLSMGVNAEFSQRPDGLPGLEEAYGFKTGRANRVPLETGLIYTALNEGEIDIGLVFSTDGRIAGFNFIVLEDNKEFFPAYALTPVVRREILDANPDLEGLLNDLSSKLDDETMQSLNSRIDIDKETVEEVAASFLKRHNLIN